MGNGTKPALFLGLRPTQGSYRFKPFTRSKEENIRAKIHQRVGLYHQLLAKLYTILIFDINLSNSNKML